MRRCGMHTAAVLAHTATAHCMLWVQRPVPPAIPTTRLTRTPTTPYHPSMPLLATQGGQFPGAQQVAQLHLHPVAQGQAHPLPLLPPGAAAAATIVAWWWG